jgi:hypothetical protein
MSGEPRIRVASVGAEAGPVVVVDHFHPDPDMLRAFAATQRFGPAERHYPGVRAPLPDDYFAQVRHVIAGVMRQVFGLHGAADILDASFSIVTRAPEALSVAQRLPHIDAVEAGRMAIVHYLNPGDPDGTAFYRHRATGFERIDADRAPGYHARLAAELREQGAPTGYVDAGGALFERTALIPAAYNRALLYPGNILHSGAISAGRALPADPATGRLTVTAFLDVQR